MSNITAYFDDETGEVSRLKYKCHDLKLDFNVIVETGDLYAHLDGIVTEDIEESYDPLKAYVDVEHMNDALNKVAQTGVIDELYVFGSKHE